MFYKWSRGHTQFAWDIKGDQSKRKQRLNDLYVKYIGEKKDGVFVEVGANDGIEGGVVLPLADLGWRGLFVEANKNMAQICRNNYFDHKNILVANIAVSNETGKTVTLYGDDAGASIDEKYVEATKNVPGLGDKNSKQQVKTMTLDDLLKKSNIDEIDVLSVDVEGHELEVFEGFSLDKHRPTLICVEMTDKHPLFTKFVDLNAKYKELNEQLIKFGYERVYKDQINTIYFLNKSV